ncbi:hypothetical protein RRG08_033232 [Elysia crispata]|uniref:Uncharacterized protein n=1 Tax=Elysia crispata TaxID=231223 RepID=A0AAE1CT92_9GAST|nr:hypothetical protein RRG08_033232 [Elysia crispata]
MKAIPSRVTNRPLPEPNVDQHMYGNSAPDLALHTSSAIFDPGPSNISEPDAALPTSAASSDLGPLNIFLSDTTLWTSAASSDPVLPIISKTDSAVVLLLLGVHLLDPLLILLDIQRQRLAGKAQKEEREGKSMVATSMPEMKSYVSNKKRL